jgi:predicted lipid-binding transport protein (Tim44 family)
MVSDPDPATPDPSEPEPESAAPEPATPQPTKRGGPPGIGPGVATGCGLHLLALALVVAFLGSAGVFGFVAPFVVVAVGAVVLMFWKPWRRFATGILIVAAASWLVFIGPCAGLMASWA